MRAHESWWVMVRSVRPNQPTLVLTLVTPPAFRSTRFLWHGITSSRMCELPLHVLRFALRNFVCFSKMWRTSCSPPPPLLPLRPREPLALNRAGGSMSFYCATVSNKVLLCSARWIRQLMSITSLLKMQITSLVLKGVVEGEWGGRACYIFVFSRWERVRG